MATKQSTIDFLLEQISPADFVTAKKMFGEYALYADGKVVALVCDDELFVKITPPGKALAVDCDEGQPYPGAKPCLRVTADRWEDREWLSELFRLTTASLPKPQKNPPKKKTARRNSK